MNLKSQITFLEFRTSVLEQDLRISEVLGGANNCLSALFLAPSPAVSQGLSLYVLEAVFF